MGADQLQGILVPALMAFPILQTSNPVRLAATQRGALSPALPVGSRLNKASNLQFAFGNFPRVLLLFTILLPSPGCHRKSTPEIIYVGTYHLPWKTLDGGKTWSSIASGMIDDSDVMSLHIDAKNPRRIFSSACSGIYRSDDAGLSWTKLQGIPYASRRTQQIVQDTKNVPDHF